MLIFFKLINEAFHFAVNSLLVNKLRTFLSLLGITIGIFTVIMVFTFVDSWEFKIKDSMSKFGSSSTLYIEKWPWSFGGNYPWWKYMSRPLPTLKEYDYLKEKSVFLEAACFMVRVQKTVKYERNSATVPIFGVSNDFEKVRDFSISEGRFFSPAELSKGNRVAIIGSKVAENLFLNANPIGKEIKLLNQKALVIGVFDKEGDNAFNASLDDQVVLPVNFMRNYVELDDMGNGAYPYILAKPHTGIPVSEVKEEIRGLMRGYRRLKPTRDDTFAMNQISLFSAILDQMFGIIGFVGGIIGGFSILVGGFGIANIMFVSVSERTNIIGIQKALGAKRYFILVQFLTESVILCLIGGSLGLLLVYLVTLLIGSSGNFEVFLSWGNVFKGLLLSTSIGIVAGFIPALRAARLDPVEAIRSGI